MIADTQRRFAGLNRLYGNNATSLMNNAHVCVVGVGGVGSWAVEALARCGVGYLTLIDADHVVESNINRQVQALTECLGQSKIGALAQRIEQINPYCKVTQVDDFIDENNLDLLPKDAIILDCCDQVKAKLAMVIECRRRKQKILLCGAAGGKTDSTRVRIEDLAFSIQDPILAKIRQKLRSVNKINLIRPKNKKISKMNIAVLYSDEAIRYPQASCDVDNAPQGLNCAGFGSSVMVTASFGMAAAQWAIDQILNANTPQY